MFVPDLVVKLSTPPVVRPYSAGRVEVVTLNSSSASTEGAVWSKAAPLSARTVLAPSNNSSVPKFCPPPSLDRKAPSLRSAEPGPTVPGVRKTNASGERKSPCPPKASGSSRICFWVTMVPTSEVSLSMLGRSPTTVTTSVAPPGCMVKSRALVVLTSTAIPVEVSFLKLCASTVTSYTPTCMSPMR